MNNTIEINQLNKYYGNVHALKDVNLSIGEGMFGLLGQNGAGKTTLMKIITTLLPESSGSVSILGEELSSKKKIRDMIGYLPQEFSMYGSMKVYEVMDYLAVLSGLSKGERKERIPILLEMVNLQDNYKTKVKALSGGMKRRLGIAQALINDPKVIVVDEPTAGLDPEERIRFRNLFSEIAKDRIVILSTHIVGDVEATCSRIGILDQGRIVFNDCVSKLIERAEDKIYIAKVSALELEEIKEKYKVTNVKVYGDQVEVKFIAYDKPEFSQVLPCIPNVEDAYLYVLEVSRDKVVDGDKESLGDGLC